MDYMFLEQSTPLEKAVAEGMLPKLEVFPAPYDTAATDTGLIRIVFPEFTCVCPRTGYPDFATISLYYLPAGVCLELKSWKLYLNSFRMVGTFHEAVTAHLFRTVCDALSPRWALLVGDFLPRGNVDTTVLFETEGPRPREITFLTSAVPPRCKSMEPPGTGETDG